MSPARPRDLLQAAADEQGVARRYLSALRRSAPLLAVAALIVGAGAYVVSEALPDTYEATAKIAESESAGTQEPMASVAARRALATDEALATTQPVLSAAAEQLRGETTETLADDVTVSSHRGTSIIAISAEDSRPADAARKANVMANTFLAVRTGVIRDHLRMRAEVLRKEIRAVSARARARARQQEPAAEQDGLVQQPAPAQRQSSEEQQTLTALRRRLTDLAVSRASAGSDLILVQAGTEPSSPQDAHSTRNAVLALFLALLAGILAVLLRERLKPRVRGSRQLSRLTGLPVLAEIPRNRRRGPDAEPEDVGEHEGYELLRGWFERSQSDEGPRITLVTSAVRGEGKTSVTANLGRALSHAGHDVLLVAGDMRNPTLHTTFGAESTDGLSTLLRRVAQQPSSADRPREDRNGRLGQASGAILPVDSVDDSHGTLSLMAPGPPVGDPAGLLSSRGVREVFGELRLLDFDHILVDGPPLLGMVDSQILAAEADAVLIVSRLDEVSLDSVLDLRRLVDQLRITPMGLVVLGAKSTGAVYETSRSTEAETQPAEQEADGAQAPPAGVARDPGAD